MSEFILEKRDVLKAYISLHSYSQMWLHPWGYSREMPPDYDDIVSVILRVLIHLFSVFIHVMYYFKYTNVTWTLDLIKKQS